MKERPPKSHEISYKPPRREISTVQRQRSESEENKSIKIKVSAITGGWSSVMAEEGDCGLLCRGRESSKLLWLLVLLGII